MANQLDWIEVGTRLREARLAAGLSQEQLAADVGLERTMIVKAEGGVRRLDALELSRIAVALNLPLAHFLLPTPPVLSRRTALLEDSETDAARDAYRLDAELAAWIRDLEQLIDVGLLKRETLLRYPRAVTRAEDARKAARWLRQQLDVGQEPLGPLIQLSERVGQFLLVADVPGDGASVVEGDLAAAVVSLRGEPGRRRATAAHELGHLVIGDEYSADLGVHASRDEREQVVDAFAGELLVPSDAVREAVRDTSSLDGIRASLVKVAAIYRASWGMVLRQAVLAEVVDRPQPLASRVPTRTELMDSVGWTPEPDLSSVRVPPTVATAVMTAFRKGLVTPQRAEELTRGQIAAADLTEMTGDDAAP